MTQQEKCEAIVRKVVDIANTGKPVMFEQDLGRDTLTLNIGTAHTHVGIPDDPTPETFRVLVDNLYNSLHGGPGLSFFDPAEL